MVLGYYAYLVFYLDEERESGIDDSASSTSIFLRDADRSSDSDEANISTVDKIKEVMMRIRDDVKAYFLNNTYDLNILVDHNNKVLIETTVMKGDLGIGLEIQRKEKKHIVVTGFKKFPSWTTNPAQMCDPAVNEGDCIVAINGEAVKSFADTINMIKNAPNGQVTLHLRRAKASNKFKESLQKSEL